MITPTKGDVCRCETCGHEWELGEGELIGEVICVYLKNYTLGGKAVHCGSYDIRRIHVTPERKSRLLDRCGHYIYKTNTKRKVQTA